MVEITSHLFRCNHSKDDDLVCYCFNYTKKDIEIDYLTHNRSLILEKIATEKKAGRCSCAMENPTGK